MDLIQRIKNERARNKKKRPFERTLFNKVSGLVKRYSLEESFLAKLEVPDDYLSEANMEFARVRKKQPFEIPLFSLLEEKDYRLVVTIINKINNAYLEFAHSPEEIALSKLLFELNPSLGVDKLEGYHFETLLQYEFAKKEIKALLKQVKGGGRKKSREREREFLGDGRLFPNSIQKRIEQLQSFIARVEDLVKSHQ